MIPMLMPAKGSWQAVASLTGMAERFGPFSRRINLKALLSKSRPIF